MAVTRTRIVPNPGGVAVATSAGEYLHFALDALGPIPIFSFVSSIKGTLYEAPDFPGHPATKYEWDHLKNPSDVQQLEALDLGLAFLTNANYTYTVELRRATGVTVKTVLQIQYVASPTDLTDEAITLVIQ